MVTVNRRTFILGGLGVAGAVATSGWTGSAAFAAIGYPFTLGVASGDPSPDGFVLWTRLAPAPLAEDGMGGMPNTNTDVTWQVANDQAFTSIAASGTVTATPAEGHSLHVEPTGLGSGREYFYRFITGAHVSPVGRTRTAPAAGTLPAQLKFSFASCAHWENGWFHAYRHLGQDNPDLILFLGDYIYEQPSSRSTDVRGYTYPSQILTLAQYRQRYAQHKTDPNLQSAHAAAPWVVVPDDHEVENNWAGGSSTTTTAQRTAAFQAYWENMPLRRSAKPTGASIPLYRRLSWGTLARFHMLDTRQFRSAQASADNCTQMRDPARTLTGAAQEQWLLDGLAQHNSTWDFLGQQVFFAQRDADGSSSTCDVSTDAWTGYVESRDRITQGWVNRAVRNPVVLTGDVHSHYAANLRVNYYDHSAPIVGAEFVTGSITSISDATTPSSTWWANNPHVKYFRNQHGYVRATLTPAQLTGEFVVVSSIAEPDPAKVTASVNKRYKVLDGQPGLVDA